MLDAINLPRRAVTAQLAQVVAPGLVTQCLDTARRRLQPHHAPKRLVPVHAQRCPLPQFGDVHHRTGHRRLGCVGADLEQRGREGDPPPTAAFAVFDLVAAQIAQGGRPMGDDVLIAQAGLDAMCLSRVQGCALDGDQTCGRGVHLGSRCVRCGRWRRRRQRAGAAVPCRALALGVHGLDVRGAHALGQRDDVFERLAAVGDGIGRATERIVAFECQRRRVVRRLEQLLGHAGPISGLDQGGTGGLAVTAGSHGRGSFVRVGRDGQRFARRAAVPWRTAQRRARRCVCAAEASDALMAEGLAPRVADAAASSPAPTAPRAGGCAARAEHRRSVCPT